ncbi:uncharacterized protein EV154DRAFT_477789 [Mucor mucedo]|uniref:uncharacterized protein n=1 Tax=Mucor mucedo TaxID=29922 RepID=UPI00221F24CB|nr:uncharacterized protein EV154DRAFT_477789 [Mucor mucedo]KAI7895014.1 hypothetical protein EV154DRAFT_477789 [Mucor mucedo]
MPYFGKFIIYERDLAGLLHPYFRTVFIPRLIAAFVDRSYHLVLHAMVLMNETPDSNIKYIDSASFWSKVNESTISLPEGLPTNLKELFDAIINDGRDTKGRLNFKKLRLKILSEKTTAVVEDDYEKSSFLDILEMRETTCKASKDIAKTQEELFGDTIPLNKGFGRRIDLLLSSHNVELSTNEWKRKKVSPEQCLIQQTKNIRMNKAILSGGKSMLGGGVAQGYQGYMFGVEKKDNIYVATHIRNLSMPEYLFQFPNLVNILDALYCWSNHHNNLEDILLPALITKQENSFFSQFNTKDVNDVNMQVCVYSLNYPDYDSSFVSNTEEVLAYNMIFVRTMPVKS